MADVEDDQLPLIKYYESRRKVMAKQAAAKEQELEAVVVFDKKKADADADADEKKKGGVYVKKDGDEDGLQGDQDLVEDFTLSSDEEE